MEIGAAEGTRTPDPIITNDVLYQLSYSGHCARLAPSLCLGKSISDPTAVVRLSRQLAQRYLHLVV